jgi:hypothetical protein
MKTTALLLFFLICTLAKAQDLTAIMSGDTTSTFYITLEGNTVLSGKMIEKNDNVIVFKDFTVGKVTIQISKIKKLLKLTDSQYCLVTTSDGKKFTGLYVSQDEKEIVINTDDLGLLRIANDKIREIKLAEKEQIVLGKYFFPNPHPTRYLYGPSAIPLEKGEGYFQNTYILSNSVNIGLSDNFSMGGGIVIPFMFFVTPKFGFKVAKNVHLGGGLLFATNISTEFSVGLGVGYGVLTLGSNEHNFTLGTGWGFFKDEVYNSTTQTSKYEWQLNKRPIITVSGATRIAPKVSIVSENWFFPTKEYTSYYSENYSYKYSSVFSLGFRIMGEKHSFDFALVLPNFEDEVIGIPFLGYAFKF